MPTINVKSAGGESQLSHSGYNTEYYIHFALNYGRSWKKICNFLKACGMKVVGLISGGKDSCFNLMCCKNDGHEIVCLANLFPVECHEIDSYMYQSVGSEGTKEIRGRPLNIDLTYTFNEKDEVEDLFCLLKTVKQHHPDIEGVSVGAINSTYQKERVEHVCKRLNLTPLCYLWERDQLELFDTMIQEGVEAIIIKVAAAGLTSKNLGMTLKEVREHLLEMHKKYGSHVCGEGGEYETYVVDCPLYHKRISVDQCEAVLHSDDDVAPVAYLKLCQLSLTDKTE